MIDTKGNLITSETNLKKHTINHNKSVLGNRPINDNLIHLKYKKEKVFRRRIDLAKINKSEPWNMEELDVVLKYIKKDKSRDPNDHNNEIFHTKVAGKDTKRAILEPMNKINNDMQYLEFLEYCNISSINKKRMKSVFDNYCGLFRVTVLRNILDRLKYNDTNQDIEPNLSDANVSCRKRRNT